MQQARTPLHYARSRSALSPFLGRTAQRFTLVPALNLPETETEAELTWSSVEEAQKPISKALEEMWEMGGRIERAADQVKQISVIFCVLTLSYYLVLFPCPIRRPGTVVLFCSTTSPPTGLCQSQG